MIIRVLRKEQSFTVLDNQLLSDNQLSFKARGILAYLLSKPPSWNPCIAELAAQGQEGRAAITSALRELKRAGYAWMETTRSEDGKHAAGRCWVISETPSQSNDFPRKQKTCVLGHSPLINKEEEKRNMDGAAAAVPIRECEGFDVLPKPTSGKAGKFARSFARWSVRNRLHVGQKGSTKYGWKPSQIQAWTRQAKDLLDQLDQDTGRLRQVWKWYQQHWNDDYIPQARSVRTFAEKFTRIETSMKKLAAVEHKSMDEESEGELVTDGKWTYVRPIKK